MLGWISTSLKFYVYGRHSIHGPYFIYVHNIYVRTQVKMKRQWKYTFSYMNWATTSRTEGVEACIRL